ncbi:MFS transporter [Lysobacter capsici]|uniref:MFS transporter n=1 Tax=Lysobacter capsici TaxID=435897 RepID=UPI0012FE2335|nr:MFS transporter [Lysobacter capsici]
MPVSATVLSRSRTVVSNRLHTLLRIGRIGLRDRRFGWLLLDNLITTFGASFTLIALPFLVMRLTGSALDLGLTAAIEALPSALLLFFFRGALDRADPARVLWWCRALYVAINAALAITTWFGWISIELIYLLALISGLVWAVAYPAGRAAFGLYIRKGLLAAGNAVFAVASSLATMALPVLAGSLILASSGDHGLALAFAIDTASVAVSLLLIAAVRRRGPVRRRERSVETVAIDSDAVAATQIPRSYYLYLLISTVLVFGPVQILLPVLLVERQDPRYFLIYAGQFVGIAIAAGLASTVGAAMHGVLRKILACWSLAALAYGLLAWNANLAVTLLSFCLLAGASNFYGIQSLSWLQRNADASRMGREMTWFSAATMGAMPLATLIAGWLIEREGRMHAAKWLAVLIVAAALAGAIHLWLRRYRTDQRTAQADGLRGPMPSSMTIDD